MRISPALKAPAADRNKEPILDVLRRVLPAEGLVLEVASGTGQHVCHFSAALPELVWQPSDPDPAMRESIRAHIRNSGATSVAAPVDLDARADNWPIGQADALICINMIHISPWAATEGLLRGAGKMLGSAAPLVVYGPFMRHGRHTAVSNEAFDASLRQRNAEWGVRDIDVISAHAEANGLLLSELLEMPANNLTLVYRRTEGSEQFS